MRRINPKAIEALVQSKTFETSRLSKLRDSILSSHPNLAADDPDLDEILHNESNLDDLQAAAKKMLGMLGRHYKLRKAYAEACKKEAEDIVEKRKKHEASMASTRAIVALIMEEFGIDSHTDGVVGASMRNPSSAFKIEVADVGELPEKYRSKIVTTTYKPMLEEIEKALAAGVSLPGVTKSNNQRILTMR